MSSDQQSRFRALRTFAELSRLSNIPTVISNVLVGFAIGTIASPEQPPWWVLLVITPAIMLLYAGGMALNDVVDVNIDRRERPGRPIPSGRVSVLQAGVFVAATLILGIVLISPFGWPARFLVVALTLTIIAYDIVHKMTPLSGVLMGACRGLVYLTVASCIAWPLNWSVAMPLALAMTVYIALVTHIARGEAGASASIHFARRLSIALPLVALLPALWVVPSAWDLAIGAGILMLGWLIFTQRHLLKHPLRMKPAVLGYLAGICLLDAYYLSLLEQNVLAIIAVACFAMTTLGHRLISGT